MTSIDLNAITEAFSDLRDTLPPNSHVTLSVHDINRFAFNSIPAEQTHFARDNRSGEFWTKNLKTDHGVIVFYTHEAPIVCDPALDEAAWGSEVPS